MRNRARKGQEKQAPPDPGGSICRMRLGDLEPGATGTIEKMECRRQLRRRLMNMGVVCGTSFSVERVAPLGDPMELKLNGFNLSLRKEEAGDIWVEVPCE